MNYTGISYEYEQIDWRVTRALLTKRHLSIDWLEGNEQGGLTASSEDGIHYRGSYSYKTPSAGGGVEFQLFKDAVGEILLLGRWWESGSANGGPWLVHLKPSVS